MSKALLICNADKPGRWLKKYAKEADFILAADGGAQAALQAGLVPDAIIGDLDSLSPRARRQLKDTPILHVARQDNTDLEKALDWLCAQQFDQCVIVGAVGGRLDFTLGNVLAVRRYLPHMHIYFQADKWQLYPLQTSISLPARPGARLSIIPIAPCHDVTLSGCVYPLCHENLDAQHIGRTLSNQVSAPEIALSFSRGFLLLYREL